MKDVKFAPMPMQLVHSGADGYTHGTLQPARIESLENTVEKLRTALAELVEHTDEYDTNQQQHEALERARAVLEETK